MRFLLFAKRIPVGIRLIIVCMLCLLLLSVFHMQPMSLSVNGHYWEAYGHDAGVLASLPKHISTALHFDDYCVSVDADVVLPTVSTVDIYRISNRKPDQESLASALEFDRSDISVDSAIDRVSYWGYDVLSIDTYYANGYCESNEIGRIHAGIYRQQSINLDESTVLKLLQNADIIRGDADIRFSELSEFWIVTPCIGELPLMESFVFDSLTGMPTNSCSVIVSQDQKANLLEVITDTSVNHDAEVLWENCYIADAHNALSTWAQERPKWGCETDITVERIRLCYQTRSIYGDPFHMVLYPVWEFSSITEGEFIVAGAINAINGEVESCRM